MKILHIWTSLTKVLNYPYYFYSSFTACNCIKVRYKGLHVFFHLFLVPQGQELDLPTPGFFLYIITSINSITKHTSRFSGFCGEKNIWPWVLMSNDMPHPKWIYPTTLAYHWLYLSKLLLVLVSQLQSRVREMFSLTTTRAYNVLKHFPFLESLFMNTLSSTMLLLN